MKDYMKYIIYLINIFLIVGLYGFIYYTAYYDSDENANPVTIIKDKSSSEKEALFNVEVKGAVQNPGVYSFENGIIDDLINAAGGFTEFAYTDNINLSRKLTDEMVVYVYNQSEYSTLNKPKIIYLEKECNCEKYDISSCINNGASVIEDGINTYNEDGSEKVNINTASINVLMTLSGIGESKAKSIIEYREENGNFKSIEDIVNVSGISQTIYEKIKDNITV